MSHTVLASPPPPTLRCSSSTMLCIASSSRLDWTTDCSPITGAPFTPSTSSLSLRAEFDFDRAFASTPVLLAPMEDVTDPVFRSVCRARGASICVTEFVHAESLFGSDEAKRKDASKKLVLSEGDAPTAIQIYGASEDALLEAAEIAEASGPAYLDLNCGCWVPKVARGGAGAAWLREPDKMVEMAARIARRVRLPVTVKTRIGWGDEETMPVVELAKRLEGVGIRAMTIHCRTAIMGHEGGADWRWSRDAQKVVSMPVIVNGDIQSADDAMRALNETGCKGVMIGRRAITHPWIFREVKERLSGQQLPFVSVQERFALCLEHLNALEQAYAPGRAVRTMRRFYPGYLEGTSGLRLLLRRLASETSLEKTRVMLIEAEEDQRT